MPSVAPTRDDLASRYLEQLPYEPYPVQEEALLAWFTAEQGVLVCAPTGTGKTLIAQAALFEALHTGKVAYYTTPLIALTEQKFREMQELAVRWGFHPDDVGLVTGNRRVNPQARVLVVVAEILLNRLLHTEAFDFADVWAVVMDEFHSFADPERGIVWELSLSMLPKHIRLLLLSATVGNAPEFVNWLDRCHGRKVELIESRDRKVPLGYHWVPDQLLGEFLLDITDGDVDKRKTPALVFCFNRDECWSIAEQLKGLQLLDGEQRTRLHAAVNQLEWTQGVGPKLKQMLHRGVGVHHAGLLPKYRRAVEELFVRKLLAVVVCTETLGAGINLPARSVVLTTLVKGPFGRRKLIDATIAHQLFGRAGRPQFDTQGYVFALAHEDDVKIARWKEKFDQIPENTKDPTLLRAKKDLKRKKPARRETEQYWSEASFKQLQAAPPGRLYSKGQLPWRLLAYLLKVSPEVSRLRGVIRKRLLDESRIKAGERVLESMLLTLATGGFVTLEPAESGVRSQGSVVEQQPIRLAHPTANLDKLLVFRSVNPLYGAFLLDHLGIGDAAERIQALESVMELPKPLLRFVRVPFPEDLPPGPLATTRLDAELVRRGLIAAPLPDWDGEEEEETPSPPTTLQLGDRGDRGDRGGGRWEERPPALADKLRLLFDATHPEVGDVTTHAVWAAGELLRLGGNFNQFVQARDLVKQEGIVFRHLLRLILLCEEFAQVTPAETTPEEWQGFLRDFSGRLTDSCRAVDLTSTDEMIQQAHAADVVEGEAIGQTIVPG